MIPRRSKTTIYSIINKIVVADKKDIDDYDIYLKTDKNGKVEEVRYGVSSTDAKDHKIDLATDIDGLATHADVMAEVDFGWED